MNLICAGISHQSAPLAVRERLQLSKEEITGALRQMRAVGYPECVLFSADDRTEVYAVGEEDIPRTEALVESLRSIQRPGENIPLHHFYSLAGQKAAEHLLRVSTGLESMIVGDVDIITQIEEGLAFANHSGTSGVLTAGLFRSASDICRRVQHETLIAEGAISVSRAAVELAERIFDDLTTKKALIVGTGETAQATARQLLRQGIGSLALTNRDRDRAAHIASSLQAATVPFESFRDHLAEIDIVIFSLQSEPFLLTTKDIRDVGRSRQGQPLFLIDCGIPHNVDPLAAELENVFLYDLDTLNKMVGENITQRRLQVPKVESIVREETELLLRWYASLEATPTIAALTELIEQIRTEEVERDVRRLKPADRALVDALTKRITGRILQLPASHLRTGQENKLPDRLEKLSIVRKLFGLDPEKKRT